MRGRCEENARRRNFHSRKGSEERERKGSTHTETEKAQNDKIMME